MDPKSRKKELKIINLFGIPGSGKDTTIDEIKKRIPEIAIVGKNLIEKEEVQICFQKDFRNVDYLQGEFQTNFVKEFKAKLKNCKTKKGNNVILVHTPLELIHFFTQEYYKQNAIGNTQFYELCFLHYDALKKISKAIDKEGFDKTHTTNIYMLCSANQLEHLLLNVHKRDNNEENLRYYQMKFLEKIYRGVYNWIDKYSSIPYEAADNKIIARYQGKDKQPLTKETVQNILSFP